MSGDEVCTKLFQIIAKGVPKLLEAESFVEGKDRIVPNSVFIESRDVLSHLKDIALNVNDEIVIQKNLVEIQEHFRRGIMETYQEHYDFVASNIFRLYENYKNSYIRFEKLLRLYDVNKETHQKIKNAVKASQELWLEARSLKNNELESDKLDVAIDKFKCATEYITSVEDDINMLYNNLYKRSAVITLFLGICVFVIVLALLFL